MGGWERGTQPLRCIPLPDAAALGSERPPAHAASSQGWRWCCFGKKQGLTCQDDFFNCYYLKLAKNLFSVEKWGFWLSWAISPLTRPGQQSVFLEKRGKMLLCSFRHRQAASTALLPAQSTAAGPGSACAGALGEAMVRPSPTAPFVGANGSTAASAALAPSPPSCAGMGAVARLI